MKPHRHRYAFYDGLPGGGAVTVCTCGKRREVRRFKDPRHTQNP